MSKKDDTLKMCIDYKKLKQAHKNRHPLSMMDDMFDLLKGAEVISKNDLKVSYHQPKMKDEYTPKIAFQTCYGHFPFYSNGVGVTNAPSTLCT